MKTYKLENYSKEMDQFIHDVKNDKTPEKREVFKEYGHAALNVLELSNGNVEVASKLIGAMFISYDLHGHGESTVIAALSSDANVRADALGYIKHVWGINL